jgi:hypothetical protein
MPAWDDVIDFDNVGDWPMQLAGWVKLVNQSAGHQQQAQAEHLVRECLQRSQIRAYITARGCSRAKWKRSSAMVCGQQHLSLAVIKVRLRGQLAGRCLGGTS